MEVTVGEFFVEGEEEFISTTFVSYCFWGWPCTLFKILQKFDE
jgi:hypothetical protein